MGIIYINTGVAGEDGILGRRNQIVSSDNLATVTTAGYLNSFSQEGYTFFNTDIIDMWYGATGTPNAITSAGTLGQFTVSISNGVITLNQDVNTGDVSLPVTSGDFAVFNGTAGQIKDSGYLPSNAAKTNVVMANGATIANHIATYTDTSGTVGEDAATAINGGNIQAGLSGTAGTVTSFPSTASKGSLILAAVNNIGNTNTTISNAAMGQASTISIPDPGVASTNFIVADSTGTQTINTGNLTLTAGNITTTAGNIVSGSSGHAGIVTSFPGTASKGSLIVAAVNNTGNTNTTISNAAMGQASVISIPDPGVSTSSFVLQNSSTNTQNIIGAVTLNNNPTVVSKVVTATFSALATAGKVNIFVAPTGTAQIAILDLKIFFSTGLSGGGGNRLLSLADGTLVFNTTGITAALLGTPIFTIWGGTGNPLPSASEATVSTAGANVYLQYIGGTTDYTAGSVIVAVTYAQVTA